MKGLRNSKRAMMSSRRRTKSARMNWEVCEKSARSMRKKLSMLSTTSAWQCHHSVQSTRTDRFQKFKQGLTESYEIQSLQASLGEGGPGWGQRKSESRNYEDKVDKLQRYAGVLRGLGSDLIAKLQGDEKPHLRSGASRIYVWGSEFANSFTRWEGEASVRMLGATALLRSMITTAPIMRKSTHTETARTMIKVVRALINYDECKANVAGRQSELDGQHNDLGTVFLRRIGIRGILPSMPIYLLGWCLYVA